MKKIAIFGGGIGGLSVAHELSKFNDFIIDIYERNDDIGGLARSKRDEDGCPTEISWRVFFGFYDNLFKTFSEIVDENNKSIMNNLIVYNHINFYDKNNKFYDWIVSRYNILYGCTSCDKRLDKMDNLEWWNALKLTNDTNLLRAIGPWLGMDRYKGSYKSVIKVGIEQQIIQTYLNKNYKDFITKKPTSEAIFNYWYKHLLKNKVNIHLNTTLERIIIENKTIKHVIIYDHIAKTNKIIKADQYILNLPVEILDKIIDNTPELQYGQLLNIKKLKNNCLHNQLSFQVYFNKSINLNKKNAFLISDSPWDLIILSYEQIYDVELCKKINVKGGWSIAVCTSYIPGIVFNKTFDNCTYNEIIIEIWSQIKNCKKLCKYIKKYNNFDLNDNLIVKWSKMWDTWYYKNNKLETTEPKFTNNAGSYALRPSFKTDITNLYLSTAYIKETIDIFSMEAANISGKYVANQIYNNYTKSQKNILIPTIRKRPVIFNLFRFLDIIYFRLGIPNINVLLILFILLIIIYKIIKKFKNGGRIYEHCI